MSTCSNLRDCAIRFSELQIKCVRIFAKFKQPCSTISNDNDVCHKTEPHSKFSHIKWETGTTRTTRRNPLFNNGSCYCKGLNFKAVEASIHEAHEAAASALFRPTTRWLMNWGTLSAVSNWNPVVRSIRIGTFSWGVETVERNGEAGVACARDYTTWKRGTGRRQDGSRWYSTRWRAITKKAVVSKWSNV